MDELRDIGDKLQNYLNYLAIIGLQYNETDLPDEYAQVLSELDEQIKIKTRYLLHAYKNAIPIVQNISNLLKSLVEIQKDENELREMLKKISDLYDSRLQINSYLNSQLNSLRQESQLLDEVKEKKINELRDTLTEEVPALDRISMKFYGKTFGELYEFVNKVKALEYQKEILESAKEKLEEEKGEKK